ncbi:MAG: DUF6264 family protein [Leucobacter sp.]
MAERNDPQPETGASSSGSSSADTPEPADKRESQDQTPPPARDTRPAPAYGEYAPEGWSWTPEQEASGGGTDGVAPATPPLTPAPSSPPAAGAGPVPGVPHNLGVSSPSAPTTQAPATARTTPQAPSSDDPAPYRAASPQGKPEQTPAPVAPPASGPSGGKLADRVVTIVLLLIGAYGALSTAAGIFTMEQQFVQLGAIFDLDGSAVPSWVGVMCTIGGLIILALYAVTLIYSIQRMRARKLAFFIPLVAGVLAFALIIIIASVVMTAIPGLMEQMSDPDALDKILEYSSNLG